jgi:peroxiredoxin
MGGLSYPLLSDNWPFGQVAMRYGVLRGDSGQCERAIFVVDRQGNVAYVDVHAISEPPPTDAIMAALDKLK